MRLVAHLSRALLIGAAFSVVACADAPTRLVRPSADANLDARRDPPIDPALITLVRQLVVGRGIVPLQQPARVRVPLVRLGRALLFDKVLSGNRNISCTTSAS